VINILFLLLHILSIAWLVLVIGAGIGEMGRNAGMILTWRNVIFTIIASALLLALDRYFSFVQSEIATWRLIPVFFSGCILVGTRVFWTTSETQPVSWILKYLPKLIGVVNILLAVVFIFG
jgi:hypothetical protein